MANVAAERTYAPPGLFRLLVEPTPGRTEFAIRVGVICALTTLVGEIFQKPPELFLAAYLVFFLNKPDRTTSVVLGTVILVLFALLMLAVLGIMKVVLDHPPWKLVSIAIVSFGLLYLVGATPLEKLAGPMALVIGFGLDSATRLPVSDLSARVVAYAWLLAAFPGVATILVNLAIAPSPRKLVQRDLAARLRLAAKLLVAPDEAARDAAHESLGRDHEEMLLRVKLMGIERVTPKEDIDALRQAVLSSTTILGLADLDARQAHEDAETTAPVRASLSATLERMAEILADGAYPVEVEAPDVDLTALPPRFAAIADAMAVQIRGFAVPPDGEGSSKPAPKKPSAWRDPANVRVALRTTAAAMTCYVIYTTLAWQGIHTAFITCYVVSLTTAADSIQKLLLRISGCLVGAAVGVFAIAFVMPHLSTIDELLAVVFLAAFVSGWIAAGSPRISYAGFQMAFAILVCVIQGNKPGFDMTTARDRIFGILIGNAVAYLFITRLWPVSVTSRIHERMVAALRALRELAGPTSRHDALVAAAGVHADVIGLEDDLLVARLEPADLRPDSEWVDHQRRAAEEIAELCEMLVLGAGDPVLRARLDRLLAAVEGGSEAAPQRDEGAVERVASAPKWEPFRSTVEDDLRHLEDDLSLERGETADGSLVRG